MNSTDTPNSFDARVHQTYLRHYNTLTQKTDRLFGYLFIFQWVVGIAFALIISPLTWTGDFAQTHIHVYAAVFLGGLIAVVPVVLVFNNPGATINRMVVAVSQILFSILFIHLTGGRIETHFHVFGSLAFLAFYRDWRPVMIGTAVTTADHLIRGYFWPQSVYGVLYATPWRAIEHAAWVLFEDFILWYSIKLAQKELRSVCESQIRLEDKSYLLEQESRQVKLLLDVATIANQSKTTNEAIEKVLDIICKYTKWPVGHAYISKAQGHLTATTLWYFDHPERFHVFREVTERTHFKTGEGLPGRILADQNAHWINDVTKDSNFLRNRAATDIGVRAAFGFPILMYGRVAAVLEFFSEDVIKKDETLLRIISHVGQQIGQVFEREKVNEVLQEANNAVKELNLSLETKVLERTRALEESQKKVLDQQQTLISTSKLSALGEMAGGVAHEINNPLAAIKLLAGQLQELINDEPLDKELIRRTVDEIEKTTNRISKIVQGLRSFSRDGSNDPFQSFNLFQLLEETLSFCVEKFKNNGTQVVVKDFCKDLSIEGRATEISQVILNLLNNSFDAIANLDEKWIKISTVDQVDWIDIQITDSGNGIAPAVQEKIFQPFFTTKDIGKGTGLGLSLSMKIINNHHGELKIDTECKNTRLIIRLPKYQK